MVSTNFAVVFANLTSSLVSVRLFNMHRLMFNVDAIRQLLLLMVYAKL